MSRETPRTVQFHRFIAVPPSDKRRHDVTWVDMVIKAAQEAAALFGEFWSAMPDGYQISPADSGIEPSFTSQPVSLHGFHVYVHGVWSPLADMAVLT